MTEPENTSSSGPNSDMTDEYWDGNLPENKTASSKATSVTSTATDRVLPPLLVDSGVIQGGRGRGRVSKDFHAKKNVGTKNSSQKPDNSNWRSEKSECNRRHSDNYSAKSSTNKEFRKDRNTSRHSDKFGARDSRSDPAFQSNSSTEKRDFASSIEFQNLSLNSSQGSSYSEIFEDEDYNQFLKMLKIDEYSLTETKGDLFAMPDSFSLAHCVAEDMNMGEGIAVTFRKKFKRVAELLGQRQKTGGLAFLEDNGRYIYYLVTKKRSCGKPTLHSLWESLKKMRTHMEENGVKRLAIPTIGCGLDRLKWPEVRKMLKYLFYDSRTTITVCLFERPADDESKTPSVKSCKVIHEIYPLIEIAVGTLIIYFGSEDGYITENMKQLDGKFPFLTDYKNRNRKGGEVIRWDRLKTTYLLYGCIVRNKVKDPFDFNYLQSCITAINKLNKKDQFVYVGIETFEDVNDDLIMDKILNLMRFSFDNVEIYVCQAK